MHVELLTSHVVLPNAAMTRVNSSNTGQAITRVRSHIVDIGCEFPSEQLMTSSLNGSGCKHLNEVVHVA
ncbi:hypothetical protein KIP88_20245 [Bradyrhizobium sp. SRL28]|uniref:hypothetical protein n=1 Tax=Bradyrhizobium sp. SRL28 TaxID=2836178 RepID=UPI001BDE65CA|nr:hypothetical protein [Bradyrhizobium sp. SRL28]MBT1512830.1 hypothetical protein [Bradyrhizobium sp. SRL28]